METPASIAKHPIHPMLIGIPIGLWIFSLVCDLLSLLPQASANWQIAAFYSMAGGLIGAFIAAIPGLIDMLSLPRELKTIALIHMGLNLTVIALYVANIWLRGHGSETMTPLWLSIAAVMLLGVSGWLGGKMVYVHGVGVQTPPRPPQ
jgi:uncharacterized membrane protein